MPTEDNAAAANEQLWKRALLSRPAGGDALAVYADTSLHDEVNIYAIQVLEESVIEAVTDAPGFTTSGLEGVTLPAGTQLFGRWTALQLTSGAVICNLIA